MFYFKLFHFSSKWRQHRGVSCIVALLTVLTTHSTFNYFIISPTYSPIWKLYADYQSLWWTQRKAVITLCPQKFSSLTMRTNRPLWAVKKAEERWRPEDHACKLGYFAKGIAHKMAYTFPESSPWFISPTKKQMLLRHPSVQLEKVLQNSASFVKVKNTSA